MPPDGAARRKPIIATKVQNRRSRQSRSKMTTGGTRFVRGGKRDRKRQHHAQVGAVVRHSQTMRSDYRHAGLGQSGWPVVSSRISEYLASDCFAEYVYRRDALRKSGRKISRKPVAAGVRGRFLSLNKPICRTKAGDENRLITTLY